MHDERTGVVLKLLELCRQHWAGLMAMEGAARRSTWAKTFLQDLRWPDNCWFRELRTGLNENHFMELPVPAKKEIELLLVHWWATLPADELM